MSDPDGCSSPGCAARGSHAVAVTYPSGTVDTRNLCKAHQAERKKAVTRSRPKRPPSVPKRPPLVSWLQCGHVIDATLEEAHALMKAPSWDQDLDPCPNCGSTLRSVSISGSVRVGSRIRKARRGSQVRVTSGASLTHDLDAWGWSRLEVNERDDEYREEILLWDGTRIEVSAKLSDHH
jgi:hypothetical protein